MILNFTLHEPTDEVRFRLVSSVTEEVRELLTFEKEPTAEEVLRRSVLLARIAHQLSRECGLNKVLIDGPSFLIVLLDAALRRYGLNPVYALIKHITLEETMPDGTTITKEGDRCVGFVDMTRYIHP